MGLQRSHVARNVGCDIRFDNARSTADLGLVYRSPEHTLNDQIAQIVASLIVA